MIGSFPETFLKIEIGNCLNLAYSDSTAIEPSIHGHGGSCENEPFQDTESPGDGRLNIASSLLIFDFVGRETVVGKVIVNLVSGTARSRLCSWPRKQQHRSDAYRYEIRTMVSVSCSLD